MDKQLTFYRRHIITSSYDGNIRMFDYSKTLVSSTLAHNAPISTISLISKEDASYTIASASHDLTGQITEITLFPDGSSSSKILASLHLHTAPLSSISSSGTWLLTSSWDGLVGFWNTTLPASDEIPEPVANDHDRKKRRRINDSSRPKRKAPLNVLKSHTGRVSQCVFSPSELKKAYSCGFDSTVRKWDTEYGVCEHTFVSCVPSKKLLFLTIPCLPELVGKALPRLGIDPRGEYRIGHIYRPNSEHIRSSNTVRFTKFLFGRLYASINAVLLGRW